MMPMSTRLGCICRKSNVSLNEWVKLYVTVAYCIITEEYIVSVPLFSDKTRRNYFPTFDLDMIANARAFNSFPLC